MFCNPHNPTGRIYRQSELDRVAQLALSSGAVLVSDEIHCGILLDAEREHVSIAGIDPDLSRQTITLYAPTKAYNMPGLGVAAAVIPDRDLRDRYEQAMHGFVSGVSPLAYAAATAAWNDQSGWLPTVNAFLKRNAGKVEGRRAGAAGPRHHTCGSHVPGLDRRDGAGPRLARGLARRPRPRTLARRGFRSAGVRALQLRLR